VRDKLAPRIVKAWKYVHHMFKSAHNCHCEKWHCVIHETMKTLGLLLKFGLDGFLLR
jgi:hypothetical protein